MQQLTTKRNSIFIKITMYVVILLSLISFSVHGQSSLTKSENIYFSDIDLVNRLAGLMQDGSLDEYVILSTVVINDYNGYYILVKLSNGETRRIFFNQINDSIKNSNLVLANNYAVLLGDGGEIIFFNRSDFHRLAFDAKVYWKEGKLGQPYEGSYLPYQIKDFVLLDPSQSSGYDQAKEPYLYKVTFINGSEVLLTLRQAYRDFQSNAFVTNFTSDDRAFGGLNNIEYIFARPKEQVSQGSSKVVVELHFTQDITFDSDMVAFEIVRSYPVNVGSKDNFYYLDLYFPNTDFNPAMIGRTISKAGYFDKIVLIKDLEDKTRNILRAYLREADYEFLGETPVVEIISPKVIWITYFQKVDQTSRNFAYTNDQTESEEVFDIPNKYSSTPFYRSFSKAMITINQANALPNINQKLDGLIMGIKELDKSGSYSKNDYQLLDVINAKELTRSKIYDSVLDHLAQGFDGANFDSEAALKLIDKVETFIIDPKALREFHRIRNQININ